MNESQFYQNKPRFNRSAPKTIRGRAVKKIKTSKTGSLATVDLRTRWKSPASKETMSELIERGVLSDDQISNYVSREVKRKIGNDEDYVLIARIAKLNLKTPEGSAAFNKLIRECPRALLLVEKAQELRSAG